MPKTNETQAGKARARGDLLGGWSRDNSNPISPLDQFPDHRQAALALLNGNFRLTRAAGGFLGQLVVDPKPLSVKQAAWINRMLIAYLGPS